MTAQGHSETNKDGIFFQVKKWEVTWQILTLVTTASGKQLLLH